MALVFRTAILLALVLTLAIELMRQIGLRQPSPAILHDLRFSECSLPCWIGILPGQTSLNDAMARVQSTFALPEQSFPRNRFAVQFFTVLPMPDYYTASYRLVVAMQLRIGQPVPVIDAIWWQMPEQANVTVGDVIGAFGAPTCLYVSPLFFRGWFLIWDTPEGITEARVMGGDKLSWSEPIDTLMIHTGVIDPEFGQHTCAPESPGYRRWSGLLTRDEYRQQRGT